MGPTPAESRWIGQNRNLTIQLFGTLTPEAGKVTAFVFSWYDQQGANAPAPDAVDGAIFLEAYRESLHAPIPLPANFGGFNTSSGSGSGDCCCDTKSPSVTPPAGGSDPWGGSGGGNLPSVTPGTDGAGAPLGAVDQWGRFIANGKYRINRDPWGAAIDSLYRVPPALSISELAFGQNFTTTPAYQAANPPPYRN